MQSKPSKKQHHQNHQTPHYPYKVIVGMSGGVDSSVSAWQLLQMGHDVEGLFMKNWEEDDDTEFCTAKQDLADAEQAADTLGIKLHTANFAAEYWEDVFEHFLAEYRQNRVPNPDVLCNKEIKFNAFLNYARQLGADKIATGHYAQIQNPSAQIQNPSAQLQNTEHGGVELLKASDPLKDQTYFLHALTSQQLQHSLFPIGNIQKTQVRAIAKQLGLANHAKKDSTGICFIGERRFKQFLQQYLPQTPGPILTEQGTQVGEHHGLLYYTLGQRQGLGIGGQQNYREAAWFVAEKRTQDNALIVVQEADHQKLLCTRLLASHAHWINPITHDSAAKVHCQAKCRHRQAEQPCEVTLLADDHLEVSFLHPQRAINPGQYVVFYQQDICLGGATIQQAIPL